MDENEKMEWMFRENIRLKEEQERLDAERKDFEKEKADAKRVIEQRKAKQSVENNQITMKQRLVNRKLEILEQEYARLDYERRRLEQEKADFERLKRFSRQRPPVQQNITYIGADFLFQGVDSEVALKKRYRDLLKIFHPDNLGGDTAIIQDINKVYDQKKKKYS